MKFSGDAEYDKNIFQNRKRFCQKVGIDYNSVISADLVHGSNIAVVHSKNKGLAISKTDGLLTRESGLFLSITIADCLPIFLYDGEKRVIGLLHGGWRGLAQNIIFLAIERMKAQFNSSFDKISVWIGPGISDCHFEVKNNVLSRFSSYGNSVTIREKKTYLNLKEIARFQFINSGIPEQNIAGIGRKF